MDKRTTEDNVGVQNDENMKQPREEEKNIKCVECNFEGTSWSLIGNKLSFLVGWLKTFAQFYICFLTCDML